MAMMHLFTATCSDFLELKPGICDYHNTIPAHGGLVYNTVTFKVCKYLCQEANDFLCSGVFFNTAESRCMIVQTTMAHIHPLPPHQCTNRTQYYRRHRCLGGCNFSTWKCTCIY